MSFLGCKANLGRLGWIITKAFEQLTSASLKKGAFHFSHYSVNEKTGRTEGAIWHWEHTSLHLEHCTKVCIFPAGIGNDAFLKFGCVHWWVITIPSVWEVLGCLPWLCTPHSQFLCATWCPLAMLFLEPTSDIFVCRGFVQTDACLQCAVLLGDGHLCCHKSGLLGTMLHVELDHWFTCSNGWEL